VGKSLGEARIAMVGMGAANVATDRLLKQAGVSPGQVVACDRKGILHPGRTDLEAAQHEFTDKWRVCSESNADRATGGIAEALRGADACLAFSQPGPLTIRPDSVRDGTTGIVFDAPIPCPKSGRLPREAEPLSATGRSISPIRSIIRWFFPACSAASSMRATKITDRMMLAAMHELLLPLGQAASPTAFCLR
jgi:malate dehydrogenase (oxaloacetate-decarboxylating)